MLQIPSLHTAIGGQLILNGTMLTDNHGGAKTRNGISLEGSVG